MLLQIKITNIYNYIPSLYDTKRIPRTEIRTTSYLVIGYATIEWKKQAGRTPLYDNKDGAYSSIYDHHSLTYIYVTYIHVSLKHRNSFEYLTHGGMKISELGNSRQVKAPFS